MAHVLPLLKALGRPARRGLGFLDGLASNTFIFFAVLLSCEHPHAYRPLQFLLGLLLLFPLSLDPMRSLPKGRLELLPLTFWDGFRLRLGSLLLSPVLWVAGAWLLFGGRANRSQLWLLLPVPILANALAGLASFLRPAGRRRLPALVTLPGRLGLLVQKNLREQLQLLDAYLALTLAGLGLWADRWRPDPLHPVAGTATFLVILALSTSAQQPFALDRAAMDRYKLLPLPGWQVLLAKNAAFLLLALALTALLAPLRGTVAALAAVALGNLACTKEAGPQAPWRFVRGASLGYGLGQVVLMGIGFGACAAMGGWVLIPALALWAGSLAWAGRLFEVRRLGRAGR